MNPNCRETSAESRNPAPLEKKDNQIDLNKTTLIDRRLSRRRFKGDSGSPIDKEGKRSPALRGGKGKTSALALNAA